MSSGYGRRLWGVVPAAGVGRRFGGSRPKQYLSVAGRTIMEWSVSALLNIPELEGVAVALAPDDRYWPRLPLARSPRVFACTGGAIRAASVQAALACLRSRGARPMDLVLVHDAARPALRNADVQRLLDTVADDPEGGLLAVPVRDTLRRADGERRAAGTVLREALWQAQTPQCFPLGRLEAALRAAAAGGHQVGDETEAMEMAGARPLLVEGSPDNIKLTHPADLALLQSVLVAPKSGGEAQE